MERTSGIALPEEYETSSPFDRLSGWIERYKEHRRRQKLVGRLATSVLQKIELQKKAVKENPDTQRDTHFLYRREFGRQNEDPFEASELWRGAVRQALSSKKLRFRGLRVGADERTDSEYPVIDGSTDCVTVTPIAGTVKLGRSERKPGQKSRVPFEMALVQHFIVRKPEEPDLPATPRELRILLWSSRDYATNAFNNRSKIHP